MEYKTEQEFLSRLLTYIQTKLTGKQAQSLCEFAKQYYQAVTIENFNSGNSIEDWYGALLSHWNLLLKHDAGESCIHIYNPTLEEHSWQSQHTIVEVVVSDMPFFIAIGLYGN